MDLMNFIKKSFQRKWIKIAVPAVILVAIVVLATVVGVTQSKNNSSSHKNELTPAAFVKSVCTLTQYPSTCISSLDNSITTNPMVLFNISLHVAHQELSGLSNYVTDLTVNYDSDTAERRGLKVCQIVLDDAVDKVNDTISLMVRHNNAGYLSSSEIDDLRTWLSTTLSDQDTCLDALLESNSTLLGDLQTAMKKPTELASNSLAIVTIVLSLLTSDSYKSNSGRRLLGRFETMSLQRDTEQPHWMRRMGNIRRLLEDNNVKPDVVVAKDGSGNFTTIGEAVKTVPEKSNERFVIYVKEGVYKENVVMDKKRWNVMIYGDGKDRTIVSDGLNNVDGTRTYDSATFAVAGQGFIAKDMGFINTAGPKKGQAVAFRSDSDRSVFYRCSFEGYQDTLYAHANRQFYRDCDIIGTVDFIFGYAAVVFQNCRIMPRQPLSGQSITITAQGNTDRNHSGATSIQKCTILPFDNVSAPTYLGRPWKYHATVVIMQTEIRSFVDPLGWLEWDQNVVPPRTTYFGEYQNTGAGSNVNGRVKWPTYKPALTDMEAEKFTVESLILGPEWLPDTYVPFTASLK